MTTEAVVINRIGVALATDSAVTISGGGKSKVFDTGDKLFELDFSHPAAAMINGNMDFLGVPWELIMKDFRERLPPERKSTLSDTLTQFLEYASKHKAYNSDSEMRYIKIRAVEEFEYIKNRVSQRVFQDDEVEDGADVSVRLIELILEEAQRRQKWYEGRPCADSLKGVALAQVMRTYSRELGQLITERFAPVDIPARRKATLKRLVAAALLSRRSSSFSTGLIVAGFAPNDMFPSLAIAEIDGAVCGHLKYSHGEGLTIDRAEKPGRVISFAQTDVADRILSGADHRFAQKTAEFIQESLGRSKDSVVEALSKAGIPAEAAGSIFDAVSQATSREFRETFWNPFIPLTHVRSCAIRMA